ncbi:MAG: hypothetical protein AAGJ93_03800 [Bacteroidota bacterium]
MRYEKNKQQLLMKYPAISDLAKRAQQRIPAVAWAYLQTGTGEEELLHLNRKAFTDRYSTFAAILQRAFRARRINTGFGTVL